MNKIIELYDDAKYRESLLACLVSLKDGFTQTNCLYIIKNIITLDEFEVRSRDRIKKLLFYYWNLKGSVEFTNDYSFSMTDELNINLHFLLHHEEMDISDFQQYLELGENTIFLERIYDTSRWSAYDKTRRDAREANNIIDFYLFFCHECSELYSFSGPHFPLFKWLINELCIKEV